MVRRFYQKTGYRGKFRKVFITLGSQGFQAVMGYRMCRWLVSKRIPILHLFIERFVEITTGISIPPEAKIGKGLVIMHFGGIVINTGTEIGENCRISNHVAIGNDPQDVKYKGNKTRVIIGNNCILREFVTVHKASESGYCR